MKQYAGGYDGIWEHSFWNNGINQLDPTFFYEVRAKFIHSTPLQVQQILEADIEETY